MEQQGLHNGEHYSLLDMLVIPVHSRSLSAPLLSCYRFERGTCAAIRKREPPPPGIQPQLCYYSRSLTTKLRITKRDYSNAEMA